MKCQILATTKLDLITLSFTIEPLMVFHLNTQTKFQQMTKLFVLLSTRIS